MDIFDHIKKVNVGNSLFNRDEKPRVGRFHLETCLGKGGMGAVFKAKDEAIDQTVAIKFMLSAGGPQDLERLKREATAMARLDHPNIVRLHGLEQEHGLCYLVMEYVDGADLGQWLESTKKTPKEIVAVFVQAGRGLSAIHSAGFVHRDFKPTNVMVDSEGRARVTDFGVAGLRQDVGPTLGGESTGSTTLTWAHLTGTGAMVGTPAYMSPEQHRGHIADQRSDVYSFCLSLWRALAGTHPFIRPDMSIRTRADLVHLLAVKERLAIRPSARLPAGVSSRVRRVLWAGLNPDPNARPSTMDAVVLALAPRRRQRQWVGAGAAAGLLTLAFWPSTTPCDNISAALNRTWDAERWSELEPLLSQHLPAWDDQTISDTYANAEAWAQHWIDVRGELCRSHYETKAVDTTAYGAQVECLEEQRADFEALLDVRDQYVLRVPAALQLLPPPEECSRADDFSDVVGKHPTPLLEATFDTIRSARTSLRLGRYMEVVVMLDELDNTPIVQTTPALRSQVLLLRGDARGILHDEGAIDDLVRSSALAMADQRDREMARALIRLLAHATAELPKTDENEAWIDQWQQLARAAVNRLGDPSGSAVSLEAPLLHTEAGVARRRAQYGDPSSHYATSDELYARAYDLRVEAGQGKGLAAARSLHARAEIQLLLGDVDNALQLASDAADILHVGDTHPFKAELELTLGRILTQAGRYEEAESAYVAASTIFNAMPRIDQSGRGEVELGLTELSMLREELHIALTHAQSAVELLDDLEQGRGIAALCNLGAVNLGIGDLEAARAPLTRCASLESKSKGSMSWGYGVALNNLAELELAVGEADQALELFREARTIFVGQGASGISLLVYADRGAGLALLAQGKPADALASLKSASEYVRDFKNLSPADEGTLAWGLAQALERTGATQTEYLPPAQRALKLLRIAGDGRTTERIQDFIRGTQREENGYAQTLDQ